MSRFLAGLCLASLLATGCSQSGPKPSRLEEENALLSEVGMLYQSYTRANQKPPQSLSDFSFLKAESPRGYGALESGQIILLYGATMTALNEGPPEGTSDVVLAYEKDVPEKGGRVLMLNRAVQTMTADEFKAAKKAAKS